MMPGTSTPKKSFNDSELIKAEMLFAAEATSLTGELPLFLP